MSRHSLSHSLCLCLCLCLSVCLSVSLSLSLSLSASLSVSLSLSPLPAAPGYILNLSNIDKLFVKILTCFYICVGVILKIKKLKYPLIVLY